MQAFVELGARVDRAWEAADFDEVALPAIAAEALADAQLPARLGGDDVLRWILDATSAPPQEDLRASFGQPPLTVYRGRRFHVQVLFWLAGSTTIHQHGFSGAFQVLEGGSLHSRWRFDAERRVSSHMLLGEATLLGSELLERGAIVPITPTLTHGLFHLESPSATIVVRSDGEAEASPQYELHPPGVAVDPFFVDPLVERQLQALRLLQASGHRDHLARASALVARADLHTVFRVLDHAQRAGADFPLLDRLADAARPRHGARVDALVDAVREGVRRQALHVLRRSITDPEHRFFLALLQNLPDRPAIFRLIDARAGGPGARERALRWIVELSEGAPLGVDARGELEELLVAALIDELDDDALLRALAATFDEGSIAAQREAVLEHRERLRRTLLAPLFVGGQG